MPCPHRLLALAWSLCCAAALAQPVAPRAAASAASAAAPAKAHAHIVVVEDDNVRIEESHVRGALRSVTVQNKSSGAKAYEVQVAPPGRDPSQEKGNAGKRTWSLFDF
jgi:CCR4-NOT transcriptional regulation complex NOT5 subunit